MITYLYWIHYEHHNDPMTQGYIGVTSDPNKRFTSHIKNPNNRMVKGGIQKGAIMTIIAEYTDEHEALLHEASYRPNDMIGWNIIAGGGKPPITIHTDETRARVSAQFRGKPQAKEHIRKRIEARKGYTHSTDTRKKISESVKGRQTIYVTCLSCKQTMDIGNYVKSHGEKCGVYAGPAWNAGKTMSTKGRSLPKRECPYCKKKVDAGNYVRWHGDKCKKR